MKELLKSIYYGHVTNRNTLGIFLIEKEHTTNPPTDNFDFTFLVIMRTSETGFAMNHYSFHGKSIVLYTIEEDYIRNQTEQLLRNRLVEWIIEGEIMFEREQYGGLLKEEFRSFPIEAKEKRMAMEFAKLIRSYRNSKRLSDKGQFLDANNAVVRTLNLLARLSVIEAGYRPDMVVWKQVRKIDPAIHKLYEEFVGSEEAIDKRLTLMLLGIEFAVNQRTESCAKHLIDVMNERNGYWTIGELIHRSEIESYAAELSSMVEFLTEKGILETSLERGGGSELAERLYKVDSLYN